MTDANRLARARAYLDKFNEFDEREAEYFANDMERFAASEVKAAVEWTPVSERLPDTDGVYLISKVNDEVGLAVYEIKKQQFRSGVNLERVQYPMAWMNKPQPYKPKEDADA